MDSTAKKLVLSAISLIAVVGALFGATYAGFTATPIVIEANGVATGSLSMSRSGTGAVFNLTNAVMGASATGSLTITNTGTISGVFSLTGASTGDTATLGAQANVKIYVDTDLDATKLIYNGALNAIGTISLGTFGTAAGNKSHTYYFHVSVPSTGTTSGDNAYQGKSVSTTLTWSATQA